MVRMRAAVGPQYRRLERLHDVLARLACKFLGFVVRRGLAGRRCGWLARPMCGDHVHMAARSLVPAGPYEPPGLSSAALAATYVHDHAAGAEVFAGPPEIAGGNARDRLAYHARDRALPQPACDIIACIWRELARHVFGPVAQVVPDAVTKLGRVWSAGAWCHTATLTLLAGRGIRSRARDLAGPAGGPVRDLRGQLRERRPHYHLSRAAPRQPVRPAIGHKVTRAPAARPATHQNPAPLPLRGVLPPAHPGPGLVPGRALFR